MQTSVSSIVPGYVQTWLMRRAHCKTGQRFASSVCPLMTVLCFWSFFYTLKVTTMLSANAKSSDGAMSCPSMKNLILRKHRSFVHFISLQGTLKCLQERHAKKSVPIVSCTVALSNSVTCCFANSSRTENGRAFCLACLGSSFWNVWSLDRRMLSLWSASFVWFCLPFAWKACTTCEMVPLTVPLASVP